MPLSLARDSTTLRTGYVKRSLGTREKTIELEEMVRMPVASKGYKAGGDPHRRSRDMLLRGGRSPGQPKSPTPQEDLNHHFRAARSGVGKQRWMRTWTAAMAGCPSTSLRINYEQKQCIYSAPTGAQPRSGFAAAHGVWGIPREAGQACPALRQAQDKLWGGAKSPSLALRINYNLARSRFKKRYELI